MNDIFNIFRKPTENFWKWAEEQIKPPIIFSAQTLILLSIYSLAVGLLATGFTRRFVIACGWMFFITGTAWLMNEKPIRVNSILLNFWISGIIICLFVFGYVLEQLRQIELWVMLPLVVMLITAINEFTDQKLNFYIPNVAIRQRSAMLLTVHLLISCWLQFFFVINNLLNEYPSLIREDFRNSAFVIKLPLLPVPPEKGELILNSIIAPVKVQINNQPWEEVEALLQPPDRLDDWIKDISEAVKQRLPPSKENSLWKIEINATAEDWGYKLDMASILQIPTARDGGIKFTSTCQVKRVNNTAINPSNNQANKPSNNPPVKSSPSPSPNSSVNLQNTPQTAPKFEVRGSSTSKIECEQIIKGRIE